MKKNIYPIGFLYVVTMLFFFSIVLVSFYVEALCIYKLFTLKAYVLVIPIVAGLFGIIMFVYILICNVFNKLIITNEGITITGQRIKGRIQYKEFVSFSEIKDIKLICANIDSKGQKLNNKGITSMRPHIFFEFILLNETSKLLYIEIYSLRQRKSILEAINKMTNLNFSYGKLEKKDESIFRKKK